MRRLIIVSDGRPNARANAQGLYPDPDYYRVCAGNRSSAELAQMAKLAADKAEDKGYDVYVVFYDEDSDDMARTFFEGLVDRI